MLTIEACRALIPDGDKLSDEEIVKIRESLYGFAKLALDVYFKEKGTEKN